ncbi:hypothetical protein CQ12_06775 [Bradyrhizobium jicamae]|uniref:Anti sigma-E protein RseA N-terminal domain-containing protein n=1 Tax=Bradyrhizobium jicamae TaxID=280332 RepID=A0A0R3L4E4_9BRAD|nr:hypothetical protein [Bradyrhizobium jicamae]KRR02775.1 hypothetical protein CQ12_06775 [Bradyrhizobium jicamae]
MIERLSHEPASVPAEDDGRSDRLQTLELLRAQLSRIISEGVGQGSVAAGQWSEIDNAEIAAFLDGSLSRADWDAVAARLANDPAARADLAAAAELLDEIQARPATVPAALMAQAAGVLAASEQNRPQVSAVPVAPVAQYRRSVVWSGFALAALAVIAIPTAVKMVGDGTTTAVKPDDVGDAMGRGIVAIPSSPTKKKDAQSCIDANGQARKSTTDWTERPRGEAPTKDNDPCGPKPAGAGKQERPASAGSN